MVGPHGFRLTLIGSLAVFALDRLQRIQATPCRLHLREMAGFLFDQIMLHAADCFRQVQQLLPWPGACTEQHAVVLLRIGRPILRVIAFDAAKARKANGAAASSGRIDRRGMDGAFMAVDKRWVRLDALHKPEAFAMARWKRV